jgi:hypothetical protein
LVVEAAAVIASVNSPETAWVSRPSQSPSDILVLKQHVYAVAVLAALVRTEFHTQLDYPQELEPVGAMEDQLIELLGLVSIELVAVANCLLASLKKIAGSKAPKPVREVEEYVYVARA